MPIKLTPLGIQKLREKLGLTQWGLGEVLDVHEMTVSKWERGLLQPNAYQHAQLLEFRKAIRRRPELSTRLSSVITAEGPIKALYLLLDAVYGEQP